MFYVIFSIALFLLVVIIGACNVLIKDKQTKEKWLLWLLNRRSSNDEERPESVHHSEEGR